MIRTTTALLAILPLAFGFAGQADAADQARPMTLAYASASTPADVTVAGPAGASAAATANPSCSGGTWPYVARECLAAAQGTPERKVVRTIAITAR